MPAQTPPSSHQLRKSYILYRLPGKCKKFVNNLYECYQYFILRCHPIKSIKYASKWGEWLSILPEL